MGQGARVSAAGGPGPAARPGRRRALALLGGSAALAACGRGGDGRTAPPPDLRALDGGWVGTRPERGHRLRGSNAADLRADGPPRRAAVLIAGGGIAGLAAARAFQRRGIDDVHVLELDDVPGGNARGHVLGGMACPLGAHYLPVPVAESVEVAEWLHQIGLLKTAHGRTVPDERHLCHSPQERLYLDGQWREGLLPPAVPGSARLAQYRRFAERVTALSKPVKGRRAFALPARRAAWTPELAALDRETFAAWLAREGLDDAALLAYLDYSCRDDYGAGLGAVSAWAGLHYFASRHGFHAPGNGNDGEDERDAVFTWPEGNAWLVRHLAEPLGPARLHTGRTVLAVAEGRDGVDVLAHDAASGRIEAWLAGTVVFALPPFVAARVLRTPPPALAEAVAAIGTAGHAPWLVANLQLDGPLVDRPGAPPAWDNVIHREAGTSTALGYVDAMHQTLRPHAGPTVLTAYHALPAGERATLLAADWRAAAARVIGELETAHPDLRQRLVRIELARWGHAMAIPRPGLQRHPALLALAASRGHHGRLRFAHGDLAGYSVFEEAFTLGTLAAAG